MVTFHSYVKLPEGREMVGLGKGKKVVSDQLPVAKQIFAASDVKIYQWTEHMRMHDGVFFFAFM